MFVVCSVCLYVHMRTCTVLIMVNTSYTHDLYTYLWLAD